MNFSELAFVDETSIGSADLLHPVTDAQHAPPGNHIAWDVLQDADSPPPEPIHRPRGAAHHQFLLQVRIRCKIHWSSIWAPGTPVPTHAKRLAPPAALAARPGHVVRPELLVQENTDVLPCVRCSSILF